jgi:hypothetical protein
VRRLAAFLGLVAVLAGCAGEDGLEAQQLLLDAQAAQNRLASATFSLELAFDVEGQGGSLVLDGGGYLKGKRAGDAMLSLRADGLPQARGFEFTLVTRRDAAFVRMGGGWQRYQLPAGAKRQAGTGALDLAGLMQFARYVKDVRVADGTPVDGEPTTRISGEVDTAGLVRSLSGLGSLPGGGSLGSFDTSKLADQLGDVRAILLVSKRTNLVRMAIVELAVEAEGRTAELKLVYRLTSANRPVRIPTP